MQTANQVGEEEINVAGFLDSITDGIHLDGGPGFVFKAGTSSTEISTAVGTPLGNTNVTIETDCGMNFGSTGQGLEGQSVFSFVGLCFN